MSNEIPSGRHEAYRQLYRSYSGPYSFHQFEVGTPLVIDLFGEHIEGIRYGLDQTLTGTLVNNREAFMKVEEAKEQPELRGQTIGLAVKMAIGTPIGQIIEPTLRCSVRPGCDAAYYFPDEIDPNSKYGCPEEYRYFYAKYGRIQVGAVTLGVTGF